MPDAPAIPAPVERSVRAYFAPVARATGTPTLWDPAGLAAFNPDAPPAPWIDLGPCLNFTRQSETKIVRLAAGAPAAAATQVRTALGATVSFDFESWGKLQLALSAGVQQINVLVPGSTVPVAAGSTATVLNCGAGTATFATGDIIAVDVDYTGTAGYLGSGLSGGYLATPQGSDTDYVRRVTLNVGRVTSVGNGNLMVSAPLLAGAPATGMQAAKVAAFVDREGGSYFQEWSALFLIPGEGGDRIAFHYPRLQASAPAAEQSEPFAASLNRLRLKAHFRALPVADSMDGTAVVCYRAYLPAPGRDV